MQVNWKWKRYKRNSEIKKKKREGNKEESIDRMMKDKVKEKLGEISQKQKKCEREERRVGEKVKMEEGINEHRKRK